LNLIDFGRSKNKFLEKLSLEILYCDSLLNYLTDTIRIFRSIIIIGLIYGDQKTRKENNLMKCSFFQVLTVCVLSLALSVCVSAQNLGDIGSGIIGGGNTGNSGSTNSSGNTGSSNNSSSGSSGSTMESGATTEFGTTIETPTFQGFQDPTSKPFIGRDSSLPFIGRDEPFGDRQTSASNKRTTTTTSSSARRATSTRMTSNRSMMSSRSGITSSSGGRTVRATTQAEFALSPMEVNHRTTEFQTRITRLPTLHVMPEQISVNLESTTQGNVAILTGTVASERERKVMKQLLLLEPGIDKVENKLTVDKN
jgi:hypothetical protein